MTLPVALDTNLLVRLLTGDDPAQALKVAELIDTSPACFVPITVVLELEWVLRGAYRLERQALITALEGLMGIRHVMWSRKSWCARPLMLIAVVWTSQMPCTSCAARAAAGLPASIGRWRLMPPRWPCDRLWSCSGLLGFEGVLAMSSRQQIRGLA